MTALSYTFNAQSIQKISTPEIEYIHRARLLPRLQYTADALGNRLQRPGGERVLWLGTLTQLVGSETMSSPVRILIEFPHRIRIEEQRGGQTHVIGFDGHNGWKQGAMLSRHEEDLIESLVFDSVDHFFVGQMRGYGTRPLGTHFRDDDGSIPNYNGHFYDIYQFADQISIGQSKREQQKLYYFNSETMLLERIKYQLNREGTTIPVEIQFSGWHQASGQQMPGTIIRLENGNPVVSLTIQHIGVGSRLADGSFDATNNK